MSSMRRAGTVESRSVGAQTSHPSPSLGPPKLSASPSPPPFCGSVHWVVVVAFGVVGGTLGRRVDVGIVGATSAGRSTVVAERVGEAATVGCVGPTGSGTVVGAAVPRVVGVALVVVGAAVPRVVGVAVFGLVGGEVGFAAEVEVARLAVDGDDGRFDVVGDPQAASIAIAAAAIARGLLERRVMRTLYERAGKRDFPIGLSIGLPIAALGASDPRKSRRVAYEEFFIGDSARRD